MVSGEERMKILVIGAGMYVTGRGTPNQGTILASLIQASRDCSLDLTEVVIAACKPENGLVVKHAAETIHSQLGTTLQVRYVPISGNPESDIPWLCRSETFSGAIIATPDHLHGSYVKALFRQKIHCLVVKPLVPTLAEARELVKLQQEFGLYGAVEFHKRWDVTNHWVRKVLSAKSLGRILTWMVEYSQRRIVPTGIFREWVEKTNIFQYLGVHYVDLIFFLTGFRPRKVLAIGTRGGLDGLGIRTWDSIQATILWSAPGQESSCFVANVCTNWIDPNETSAMSDQRFKIIGTQGRLECDQKNRGLEMVLAGQGPLHPNPYFSDFLPDATGQVHFGGYGFESVRQFLLDVRNILSHGCQPEDLELVRPTFSQALVSTAVIEGVNASLENGFSWQDIA
jgi:D-galacturonate reductase